MGESDKNEQSEDIRKLRVLLPHWIEHNGEHGGDFRRWAERAGSAREALVAAADLVDQANARLAEALEHLGGPLELPHHEHGHGHHHEHHHYD